MSVTRIRETDLYRPVHDYLVAQGYTVRSEVKSCDITATQGEELIVIELKCSFGLELLAQAVQRQRMADSVYVAVPRPSSRWMRDHWRGVRLVLRRLELGLIFVTLPADVPLVQVVFHPLPYARQRSHGARRAILKEITARSGEYNQGGSTRTKLITAYREQAIFIACCLERNGAMTPKALRALGTGPKTLSILNSNFYQWFQRIERGVYDLCPEGRAALGEFAGIAGSLRAKLEGGETTEANAGERG